jgi:type II secretory pathway component PulF
VIQKTKKPGLGSREIVFGGVGFKDRLLLVEQLHAGVRAGYSITDALELGLSQSRGRMKQILTEVIRNVNNGAYLFEAFGKYPKYFSPLFLNLIKTGEVSASLEGSLLELHNMLQKEAEFSQKIRGAMTYPTFVFIAIAGLGLSVSYFVLPGLLPLFKSLNTELPASTRLLLWIAEAFDKHGTEIIGGLFIFIILALWLARQKFSKPFIHWLYLQIPIFGKLYKKIIMARFARTMNALLKSGVTVDRSLEYTAALLMNSLYYKAVMSILPRIAKGETLSESLQDYPSLFESLFLKMLSLGEKTASLEQSFNNVAESYEREVDYQTKNLMTSLEPILLIFVGLIVGFVAISILMPIYSISGSVGR